MDHRAGLSMHLRTGGICEPRVRARVAAGASSGNAEQADGVCAEQAIFTSLRGAMGEGYRLVAMSPGINAEERVEITRRSPSHGSIRDPGPDACALASYRLATGRQCIAWTRHAGKEHTARGGLRVHTHLVVLEPDGFQAFACDPFAVQAALAEMIGDDPDIKPSLCMSPLSLSVGLGHLTDAADLGEDMLRQACCLCDALQVSEPILAVTSYSPVELVRWTMAVLPRAGRESVTFSANLHYAASRGLRVTCLNAISPDERRAIQGRDILEIDLATAVLRPDSTLAGWFRFAEYRRQQGRIGELCTLASQLDGQVDNDCLNRIADIARDCDCVEQAAQPRLEELVNTYSNVQPPHEIERALVRQLLSAAVRRAGVLQH